jgi:murein DD-endopeptidase MepM/ murein hydrolase activator NlpD
MRMKFFVTLICFFYSSVVIAQLQDGVIKDLKTGRIKDNITPIYWLPYKTGNRYLFIQGANSSFSHKNELAYDFKMTKGSTICAARAGVVIALKNDSDRGGLKDEYLADGNHIIIKHSDGSVAQYWHLQLNGTLVNVGDTVQQGQAIALSGNTGYTAFPHLHFQVLDKNNNEILVRFLTKKGILYIRPGRRYKAVSS